MRGYINLWVFTRLRRALLPSRVVKNCLAKIAVEAVHMCKVHYFVPICLHCEW